MAGIQANQFNKLARKLTELGQAKFVEAELTAAAFDIEADAKMNASMIAKAPPELKQMINTELSFTDTIKKAIIRQNFLPMGAYMEFGTGVYVKVAPEWKDMAWQFYVNGKGRLRATPYMYPAFVKGRKNLMRLLKLRLKQELAK